MNSRTVQRTKSAQVSVPPCLKKVQDPENGDVHYEWKNDMVKTEQFWMGWFKGLTNDFLTSKLHKILFIADKIRLDKELTIAYMSGKFKLFCFPSDVGHCMQEDDPFETARACHFMLDRFKVPMNLDDLNRLNEVGIAFFDNEVNPYVK